jgi:hypothetical protein
MTEKSIFRKLSLVIAVAASVGTGAVAARANDIGQRIFRIPGTNYDVVLDEAARRPNAVLGQPLLGAIAVWLSNEFGLPAIQRYPDIAIVSSDAIIALRYQGLLPHAGQKGAAGAQMERPQTNVTLAIYSDHAKTIYLVEGWSGRTPADLSVLVHEMVHHFQNVLGLKHDCPQEREKLAYRAQDRWLGLFGHSLETDFELDGFSLLGKTGCFY